MVLYRVIGYQPICYCLLQHIESLVKVFVQPQLEVCPFSFRFTKIFCPDHLYFLHRLPEREIETTNRDRSCQAERAARCQAVLKPRRLSLPPNRHQPARKHPLTWRPRHWLVRASRRSEK